MSEAIITLIMGVRGCGKSIKLQNLISNKKRLIVYDKLHEYTRGIVFNDFNEFVSFWRDHHEEQFRLIYRPGGDIEENANEIGLMCQLAGTLENCTLAIEELNIIFLAKRPPKEFNQLVFGGRHANVEIIGTAQRPKNFPDLISQAKELYVFNMRMPADVKFFADYLGAEHAKTIQDLPQYSYLHWHIENGEQKFEVAKDNV